MCQGLRLRISQQGLGELLLVFCCSHACCWLAAAVAAVVDPGVPTGYARRLRRHTCISCSRKEQPASCVASPASFVWDSRSRSFSGMRVQAWTQRGLLDLGMDEWNETA